MSQACLPPVRPYHPTTFLERGVAMPFTTPLLAGTRARPNDNQDLELVIPNPSGGRGVYVMAWGGITEICRPTLHDRQLHERIAGLRSVTPGTIRRIGREVAAEGLAGEEAMEAARTAGDSDRQDRLVANYSLLMALVEQVGVVDAVIASSDATGEGDLERRSRLAVARIAPQLGRPVHWVASALEELANVLSNVGVRANGASSRIPRLVSMLQQMTEEVSEWSRSQFLEEQADYAALVCTVAGFTLTLSAAMLGAARALPEDVVGLLRNWSADPDCVTRVANRPEWLLDGWEPICLIWRYAQDDAARRAALLEMAALVPVLPREVREWTDLAYDVDLPTRLRRMVTLNTDWRTGATVFELIARNEHICAASFGLPPD